MFNPDFQIGSKKVGFNHPCYIVAEMSANHGQDINRAKELVHAANEAGADAIKLQTYTPDTLTMKSDLAHFKASGPWSGQSLYSLYQTAHMPWWFHNELFELSNSLGLTCFSSPFDKTALDLLVELNAPAYKIASPEIIDHQLIRDVASTGKPIIISTGGATLAEINEAVDIVSSAGCNDLCLMKCTSAYPAPDDSINLSTISDLKARFDCPVGFSDHTLGNEIALASVVAGACMIEKHFTLKKSDNTADSFFSMTPDELADLVKSVRRVEKAIGSVKYSETPSAERRCVYVVEDVSAGEVLTAKHLRQMRPGGGEIMPKELPQLIGKVVNKPLSAGRQLSWDDIL
ncbi:MAG: pseudaminic acid synthase [Pseudomonadota bacterium]|nr:pseudaminic acid synthase [Pseudomonadota bacterium]|tara:strand:+ start:2338 stop:3375 length:1038 start_codon:yes stop_codon:yes gene_type:complete